MALALKYELQQFHVVIRADGTHVKPELLVTTYETVGNVTKQRSRLSPDFPWAQLPPAIQATLTTLGDQVIAALQAYYGTSAVTVYVPPPED